MSRAVYKLGGPPSLGHKLMKKPMIFLLSVSLLTLCSCTHSNQKNSSALTSNSAQTEESFAFSVKTISLKEGESKQVEFQASAKASFVSSNPAIAEMNAEGRLLAKSMGQATITGRVGAKTDTLEVTVTEDLSDAFQIVLPAYRALTLETGENAIQLNPKLLFDGTAQDAHFTFASEDENIAMVDDQGNVTAKKEGKTEIVVSSKGCDARIVIDVYTRSLKNAAQWLEMLKKHNDHRSRYALGSDIDFAGVEYTGYPDSSQTGYDEAFRAEINGFGHSVSNITFSEQSMNQSLFGIMQGAIIRNVSFENMTFTQTDKDARMAGLGYSLIDNDAAVPEDERRPNFYENLSLDMTFPATDANKAGLFSNGYVYHASNLFVSMKNADGSDFNRAKCATVNSEQYFWWGNGTLSNSVFLSTNELGVLSGDASQPYGTLETNKTDFVTNAMDAMVSAYSCLSHDVWDFHGTDVPTLKNTIY